MLFFLLYCIPILLAALPILVTIIIYRWLAKKGYPHIGIIISLLIIGFETYTIYTAIYPLDDFYKDDFEYETKLKFPKSANIIAKDASYPDFQGQYVSDARIELSNGDYTSLLNKIRYFDTGTYIGINGQYFDKVVIGIDKKDIIRINKRGRINIGFLNDNKTIIVERELFDH